MRTVRSSSDIDRAFQSGQQSGNRFFRLIAADTPSGRDPEGRVAFIAGKKLGSAPLRSRSKRVLRETFRRVGRLVPGSDLILIARRAAASATPGELDNALKGAFERLGLGVSDE